MKQGKELFIKNLKHIFVTIVSIALLSFVNTNAFAECEVGDTSVAQIYPADSITAPENWAQYLQDNNIVVYNSSQNSAKPQIGKLDDFIEGQEWTVEFETGTVSGYAACGGNSYKASITYTYPWSSAFSGCLCSLDKQSWYFTKKVGTTTGWLNQIVECYEKCPQTCAQYVINNETYRERLFGSVEDCPIVQDPTKKTCRAGTYLPVYANSETECVTCEEGFYCSGGTYDLGDSRVGGRNVCPSNSHSASGQSYCECDSGYSKDGTFEGDITPVVSGDSCVKIEVDLMSVNTSTYWSNSNPETLESLINRGVVTYRRQDEGAISRSNNKIQSFTEFAQDLQWGATFLDGQDNELYTVTGYAFCSTKSNDTTTPIGTKRVYGGLDDQAYVGCWCKIGENGPDGNSWTRLEVVSANADDWYVDTDYCRVNCPLRCAEEVATSQTFREYIYDDDVIPTSTTNECEDGYAWSNTAYMCKKICPQNSHTDESNSYCVCNDGYSVDGTETGSLYPNNTVCQEITYCNQNEFIQSGSCRACPQNSHSDGGNIYQCQCDDGYILNGATTTDNDACSRAFVEIIYDYTNGGSGCENDNLNVGESKELNCVPNRDDYDFAGWFDAVNGGNRITNVTANDSNDIVLYAQWKRRITIHFDPNANGHDTTAHIPSDILCTEGDVCEVIWRYSRPGGTTIKPPVRTGYGFDSWNQNEDGSGIDFIYIKNDAYTNLDEFIADLSGVFGLTDGHEITLYAQWTPENYSIRYYSDGALLNEIMPNSYTYSDDDNQTLTTDEPTKSGYNFVGWCDNEELEGACAKTISVPAGYTEPLSYYAKWESVCSDNEYWDGDSCECLNGYVKIDVPWANNYKLDADDYEPLQSAHPETYEEMRDNMNWRATYFNIPENREMAGIVLFGDAFCSSDASRNIVSGTAQSGSDVRDELNGEGQYCWCRMTSPSVSRWVYIADIATGGLEGCQRRCPGYCGSYISGVTVKQSVVRRALYDNVITNTAKICVPVEPDTPVVDDGQCVSEKYLHVGANAQDKMCLSAEQMTHPALAVKIGNKTYYANMTDQNVPVNSNSDKKLRILYGNTTYNIHEQSAE